LYDEWKGIVTEEKLEQASKEHEELNKHLESMDEGQTWSDEEMTLLGVYENIAYGHQIEQNAQEKINELLVKDTYSSQLHADMLKKIDTSFFAYNKAPKEIIDYASFFSIIITGAMLLVGLSTIYSQEYSTGVDNYIFSSKKGRGALLRA